MLDLDTPLAAYRVASEAGDVDGMVACLAPGVVLRSPVTDGFVFAGRDQLRVLLQDVESVVSDVRYDVDAGDDHVRVLRLSGVVGGQRFDEALLVELDDAGLITSLEIFVRPMPGLTTLAAQLAPRVARHRGRLRALVVRLMLAPLAFMTRRGERLGARLSRP
jgi:hypothetical protein